MTTHQEYEQRSQPFWWLWLETSTQQVQVHAEDFKSVTYMGCIIPAEWISPTDARRTLPSWKLSLERSITMINSSVIWVHSSGLSTSSFRRTKSWFLFGFIADKRSTLNYIPCLIFLLWARARGLILCKIINHQWNITRHAAYGSSCIHQAKGEGREITRSK